MDDETAHHCAARRGGGVTRLRRALACLLVAGAVAVAAAPTILHRPDLLGNRTLASSGRPMAARQVLEYVESIIRETKPAPPEAAREYAYVSTAYGEALQRSDDAGALAVAMRMTTAMFPGRTAATDAAMRRIARDTGTAVPTTPAAGALAVLATYQRRAQTDGHDRPWGGVVPTGAGRWVAPEGKQPLAPMAGRWKRWVVDGRFSVPPPPAYGSAEDLSNVEQVSRAVQGRTGADVAVINFWAGAPGTNTPAGIWQDQLFATVQRAPAAFGGEDRNRAYASAQMVLAQTIADAFMECWSVKFTYWTARPSQRTVNLSLAMPDPLFPSYVSGHSTVSKAAAEVLAVMVPAHAAAWRQMAVDARESRLAAGIHFPVDNRVGFQLGADVAAQVVSDGHLQPLTDG